VHLVVSATTKADDLAGILEGFAPLQYNRIIVSKLDETRSLGCLYNINKLAQVPISYFAVGQSVPEDLRSAQLSFIQSWIEQGRIT
jgi:flagellar biosynthesis protein FlhF